VLIDLDARAADVFKTSNEFAQTRKLVWDCEVYLETTLFTKEIVPEAYSITVIGASTEDDTTIRELCHVLEEKYPSTRWVAYSYDDGDWPTISIGF
jgi:hypothetical protein